MKAPIQGRSNLEATSVGEWSRPGPGPDQAVPGRAGTRGAGPGPGQAGPGRSRALAGPSRADRLDAKEL